MIESTWASIGDHHQPEEEDYHHYRRKRWRRGRQRSHHVTKCHYQSIIKAFYCHHGQENHRYYSYQ